MNVTFIQTADAYRYSRMLDYTSKTVKAYAEQHGFRYESYVGIKKGQQAWQASFNRLFIIDELLSRGVTGWVCYMDADAWIADLSFDLREYLADKQELAGVFAPSGSTEMWWDINDGVFLLNLDHVYTPRLVRSWLTQMERHWHLLVDLDTFPPGGPDDQSMLQEILEADGRIYDFHHASRDLINSQTARFIRQHLRADQKNFNRRVDYIRDRVNEVLGEERTKQELGRRDPLSWDVIEALYMGLLARAPDGDTDNGYYKLLVERGLREGTETTARNISESPEFRARFE